MNRTAGFFSIALFLVIFGAAAPADAARDFGARPYFRVGLGRSLFLDPAGSPGLRLDNPSGQPYVNATAGYDLSKYWGVEFSLDYAKTGINDSSGAQLGNFLTLAGIGELRLRYPLDDGRFVPYGFVGGGDGWGYFSSRKDFNFPSITSPRRSTPIRSPCS